MNRRTTRSASNFFSLASRIFWFLYSRSVICLFSCFCSIFSSRRSCFLQTTNMQINRHTKITMESWDVTTNNWINEEMLDDDYLNKWAILYMQLIQRTTSAKHWKCASFTQYQANHWMLVGYSRQVVVCHNWIINPSLVES